jgi:hypothetical protein
MTFDPFESFQQTTPIPNNILQPMNPSTATNKTSSNDLDFFMTSNQAPQQSPILFPTQQQQQQQHSFVRPPMFQQQSMMFSTPQQQFNKPNNNSFNVSF